MNKDYIGFYEEREVIQIVSATFKFLRENAISFFSMIIVLMIPVISVVYAYIKLITKTRVEEGIYYEWIDKSTQIPLLYSVILTVIFVANLVLLVTAIYQYVFLYIKTKGCNFSVLDLIKAIGNNYWNMVIAYLGVMMLMTLLAVFIYLFIVILNGLSLGLFREFVYWIAFIPTIYWMLPIVFVFPVYVFEKDKGINEAIKKAYYLVNNDRSYCFGMMLSMTFIQYSVIFSLIWLIGVEDSHLQSIFVLILRMFTLFFPILGLCFQYFSLTKNEDGKFSFLY